MPSPFETNPTQFTGLIVFAAAALSCAVAARRGPRRTAAVWRALAALQCLFVAEILLGLRHRLHDGVDAVLQQNGLYASRQGIQVALVVAAAGLSVLALAALVKLRLGSGGLRVRSAVIASAAVLALFVLETISLHPIDAVLYRLVGPVMAIACLWAACGAVVVWASARPR